MHRLTKAQARRVAVRAQLLATRRPTELLTVVQQLVHFFDDAFGRYMNRIFDEVDAFVLGRKTYEIFAASWPKATDPDDPVASRLNTLPKYVASRSLARADWQNSTALGGDVVAEVATLKEQPGRELQIHGSGALAQTLFDAGLIDTIRLIVFPVVLGSGERLFAEGRTPSSFRLAEVTSTRSGHDLQGRHLAVHHADAAGGQLLRLLVGRAAAWCGRRT